MTALDFKVVGLQHLCRAEEVELPCLAQLMNPGFLFGVYGIALQLFS